MSEATDRAAALDHEFRRFMDATADEVVIFDVAGEVTLANRAAEDRRIGAQTDRSLVAFLGVAAAGPVMRP